MTRADPIVVTGMGAVSPLGVGIAANWRRLIEGRSGVVANTRFDVETYACKIAGLVPSKAEDPEGFDPLEHMNAKDLKKADLFIQYAVAATDEALIAAGWAPERDDERARTAVVIATGPWASKVLKPLGIHLPIYPVKGYSLTCEIEDFEAGPRSSVMDEHSKVMICRLGSRLRAAGVAELAGFDPSMPKAALEGLRNRIAELFPGAANYGKAEFWHGFRPMTPGGPAHIGPSRYANLFLNVGHGSNGWTQACGAARVLTEKIAGRPNPIDIEAP